LTGEENSCGEKLLLEAPIVDPWVTMRSSILSAVASVLAGMELMVHLGMRAHWAEPVGAEPVLLRACRTMRARPWEQSDRVACRLYSLNVGKP